MKSNAEALQANPRILAGLQEMISERLKTPVRHVRSEAVARQRIHPSRAHTHLRAYTRHWFDVTGTVDPGKRVSLDAAGQLVVFAKSALNLKVQSKLETLLSEQSGRGFRVPYFFGCFEESGMLVGAWEFVPMNRVQVGDQPWENLARLARAIAGINSLPVDGAAAPMKLWPSQAPWLGAAFDRMDKAQRTEWADTRAQTLRRLKQQDASFTRMRAGGDTFLTHNDVGIANLLVPESGDVVLFDWEGATLGVAGTDLNIFERADAKKRLVECYVDQMAEHGVRLDPENIRYVADVTWGYTLLRRGWVRHNRLHVDRGLKLLAAHLD